MLNVKHLVCVQIDNRIYYSMAEQVQEQVKWPLWYQISGPVRKQIRNQVQRRIANQVQIS